MEKNYTLFIKKMTTVMETLIALVLVLAVAVSIFILLRDFYIAVLDNTFDISAFLSNALTLIICVEFIKMLVTHTPGSVIEVMLYAIARQMVVAHGNTMENLISVLAIMGIFITRKYFFVSSFEEEKRQKQEESYVGSADKRSN